MFQDELCLFPGMMPVFFRDTLVITRVNDFSVALLQNIA